jgi:hypothetical protein
MNGEVRNLEMTIVNEWLPSSTISSKSHHDYHSAPSRMTAHTINVKRGPGQVNNDIRLGPAAKIMTGLLHPSPFSISPPSPSPTSSK